MDIKVYKKETVQQPDGDETVYVPDIIDLHTQFKREEISTDIINGVWNIGIYASQHSVSIEDNVLIIEDPTSSVEGTALILNYDLIADILYNADILTDNSKDGLEQACALATIFQRGLDPLDINDGIRWSQVILEELSVIQLIQDIMEAVGKVSASVKVVFDTVEDETGQQYLSYKLLEVV